MPELAHVHLKVSNLDRSVDFYTRYFDLRVMEVVANQYAFLTAGGFHHNIAIHEVTPERACTTKSSCFGLYHVAFAVADMRQLAEKYQQLTSEGINVVPVDHLISWSLYFSDPDGNGLEIFWDTRNQPYGDTRWNGNNKLLSGQTLLKALQDALVV